MMNKNTLLAILIPISLFACIWLTNDPLFYLAALLMGLVIIAIMKTNRSMMLRLTRWAKANPRKAQVLITGLQLVLIAMGIIAGYNLRELGYEISYLAGYVFFAIMVIGFLLVPFLPKLRTIAIPKVVNRQRLAYLAISLSALFIMTMFGNRVGDQYPDATITRLIQAMDRSIFPVDISQADLMEWTAASDTRENSIYTLASGLSALPVVPVAQRYDLTHADPSASSDDLTQHPVFSGASSAKEGRMAAKVLKKTKKERRKKLRRILGTGMCALAILFIILLLGTTCAGVCLIVFAASGEVSGIGFLLGPIIVAGSIWGMIRVSKWCRGLGKNNT